MNNNASTGSNTNILQLVQTYLDRLFTGNVEYFTQYGKFDQASVVPALNKNGFQLGRTIVLAEVNV